MNLKKQLILMLCLGTFCSVALATNAPTLQLNFNQYTASKTLIEGGKILQIPNETSFVKDLTRNDDYLYFNGLNDNLHIELSNHNINTLKGSFSIKFDFYSRRLPRDDDYRNPEIKNIEVFAAIDAQNKTVLAFYLNQDNRFTVEWVNHNGKRFEIQTSWNHGNNYEVASLQRNKWYRTALIYNKNINKLEIYLDGEKIGSTKTEGILKDIKQFRFGGNLDKSQKNMFLGGLDNVKLFKGITNNKQTDKIAQKKAWQRLYNSANVELSRFLKPEKPEWANHHPRMLLTPARIKILKEDLKKGKGPKLVERLLEKCDAMMNPNAFGYVNEIPVRSWDATKILGPIELSLATILTGDKKYAQYAIKLVCDYTTKRGLHDVDRGLYGSGEGMVRQGMVVTWTYDWAYQYFTPEQRQQVRLFLLNIAQGTYNFYKGDVDFQSHTDGLSGWVANWTAMSVSTLGNTSLAILGETNAPAKLWLDYAIARALQYGFYAIGTEGCFHEMINYFAYGAAPILPFMESYYTAGGDDILSKTNFSKLTNFIPYVIYPNSRKTMSLKYASSGITVLHNVNSYPLALLRKKFGNQQAEWCWQRLHENQPWYEKWSLFSIIWFKPDQPKLSSPNLPLAKWFKSEGFVAFRSDWTRDGIAGIFMAYPAKMMSHDQSDRGQFTLYGYQGRWIIDNGGRGNPKQGWRDAHNLITVDNKIPFQKARLMHNFHHDSFITNYCSDDSIATTAEADLTDSYRYTYTWGYKKRGNNSKYEDMFKDAQRKIVFMREKHAPSYLLVYDTIQQDDKEHSYTLNLHTDSQNEVSIQKDKVEFKQYPIIKGAEVSYLCWPGQVDKSGQYYYKGRPYNGEVKYGQAQYIIDVPVAGQYNLYGFGRPGEKNPGGMDSFFIKFGKQKSLWGVSKYSWSKINKKPYELKAGQNILTVLAREPESKAIKFVLYPVSAGIPVFNSDHDDNLILIDASKPNKLSGTFFVKTEKLPASAYDEAKEAYMTLYQLAPKRGFKSGVFPGLSLPHLRLQVTDKAVQGKFLNFFYPRNAKMEQPILKRIDDSANLIVWKSCQDLICYKESDLIIKNGLESDADLIVIRKQSDKLISFVMLNGTYLKYRNQMLINLLGGKGIASWTKDTLAISGQDLSDFVFNFPLGKKNVFNILAKKPILKKVTANGKNITVKHTDKGWQSTTLLPGNKVLTW